MKTSKKGSRHPLLMYRRTMDRVWKYTLLLGVLLIAVGWWSLIPETEILGLSSDIWLFLSALLALMISFFAFFGRFFAYVRAGDSYIHIVTPFLRFKISYRRMLSVHPVLVQQLFAPQESNWSQRAFLEPYYGQTVLVVEMRGYPLDPTILRLFLPRQMFSPRSTGLVLLISDWMKLSTEIDSLHGAWLQTQGARQRASRNRQ